MSADVRSAQTQTNRAQRLRLRCESFGLSSAAEHPVPPHQHARHQQQQGDESENSPKDFAEPAGKSAEVQTGEPEQNCVAEAGRLARFVKRTKEVNDRVKRLRKSKVDS